MFGNSAEETTEEYVEKKVFDASSVKYVKLSETEAGIITEKLKDKREFALEVMTTEAEHFDYTPTAIVICVQPSEVYLLPLQALEVVKKFLLDEDVVKIGHNIKHSLLALKKVGVEVRGYLFDTLLAHYLIEPEASHDLGIICGQYLGYQLSSDNDAFERVDQILQLKPKLQRELEHRTHSRLMR
ncbi:MAG: hypothetical protein ACKO96_28870, partial [Flammeovirgaceae bacterium]